MLSKILSYIYDFSSGFKLKVVLILSLALLSAGTVCLLVGVLASEQGLNYNLAESECKLKATTNLIVDGDGNWIGISYIVPNLTKLTLNLNTRVKTSKNAILALLLNGTLASNPIGFPLGTPIPTIIGNTVVTTTGV